MNDIQGYIFDCDGTLTDSMPLHYVAWHKTMCKHGIEFSEDRFYALAGMPTEKIIELLSSEQSVAVDAESASLEKEQAFLDSIEQLCPIEPVVSKVKSLMGHCQIGVASGGTRGAVLAQLRQIQMHDVFPVIVTAEDTELHKPEPDAFLRAAELMRVDPRFCCVYEDSDLGIQAAKSAGMTWVDVRSIHSPRRVT